jgi:orotate phosphoribosyltransferase
MDRNQIEAAFKKCGAFLQGHFLLTSGLHSPGYLQCALVCQDPAVCALGARGIYTERGEDGKMTLRRGFALNRGERIIVAEDVMTTGGSAAELIEIADAAGAEVAGVVALVDRGGAKRFEGRRVAYALKAEVPTYSPAECPLCKQGIPLVKPGSRKRPGA